MEKEKEWELLALVKKNYAEIASDFDRTRKKKLWPELSKLAADVKKGSKVLDAGCGNGRLIEALKEKDIFYSGFDNSEELIALAKKNYPSHEFFIFDILDVSAIADKSYDVIFCVAVIPHIPGHENRVKVLKDLSDKLVTGGKMIISFWDLRSQSRYRKHLIVSAVKKIFGISKLDHGDVLFDWKGPEKSKRYYHAFSEKELKDLTHDAGLKLEKLYRADNNFWLILKK